jgi:uncharacterized membrane protein
MRVQDLRPLLLLAYPLLVQWAVAWHEPRLEWLALLLLCAIPQYEDLCAGRRQNWLLLLLLGVVLYALVRIGGGVYALFLPPVLITASVLAVFAGSLRAGQVPLVTRIAQTMRGALNAEVLQYTRRVTQLWVLVMLAITVAEVGLALFAPLPVWSLFSNGINYLLVGLVFLLEYLYRRRRFPEDDHPGFLDYVRRVARIPYRMG